MAHFSLSSTIRKNEKVVQTLREKKRNSQVLMIEKQLNAHRNMLKLLEKVQSGNEITFDKNELEEMIQEIDKVINRIKKITLREGSASYTLTQRRIKTYDLLKKLIHDQM